MGGALPAASRCKPHRLNVAAGWRLPQAFDFLARLRHVNAVTTATLLMVRRDDFFQAYKFPVLLHELRFCTLCSS